MSATRLLVLGVVRMYGKAHGYQVRRELLTWSADKWANVAPGSIYHALKKAAAENLLEEVTTDGEAKGPDRTAYQLTADGETEFQQLLGRSLAESEESVQGTYRFSAALTFLPALPRDRAVGLLRHRLTQLKGQRATARHMLDHGGEWGQPAHVNELYRLWVTTVEAMVGWLEELVEKPGGRRVRDGRRRGDGVRRARLRRIYSNLIRWSKTCMLPLVILTQRG